MTSQERLRLLRYVCYHYVGCLDNALLSVVALVSLLYTLNNAPRFWYALSVIVLSYLPYGYLLSARYVDDIVRYHVHRKDLFLPFIDRLLSGATEFRYPLFYLPSDVYTRELKSAISQVTILQVKHYSLLLLPFLAIAATIALLMKDAINWAASVILEASGLTVIAGLLKWRMLKNRIETAEQGSGGQTCAGINRRGEEDERAPQGRQ